MADGNLTTVYIGHTMHFRPIPALIILPFYMTSNHSFGSALTHIDCKYFIPAMTNTTKLIEPHTNLGVVKKKDAPSALAIVMMFITFPIVLGSGVF